MRSVQVVVRGHVQGVGFRWFTRDAARERGVTGWVRNRRDGSVEAELHGADADVETVLDRMRHGPAGARVGELDVTEATATAEVGFEIRHHE